MPIHHNNKCDATLWLQQCLPVIIQPKVDVEKDNQLVRVFYEFFKDDNNIMNCRLCVVYAGESTFYTRKIEKENLWATCLYRSYNRKLYGRTADIDYLEYKDVNFDRKCTKPWKSIFTTDHAGNQTWSEGSKGDIFSWFSLMHHYSKNISYGKWQKYEKTHRPLLYVNTCNHMWGEVDHNPDLSKHVWSAYYFQEGDKHDALEFAQKHNLYSIFCFCFARNGGGCCDRKIYHGNED